MLLSAWTRGFAFSSESRLAVDIAQPPVEQVLEILGAGARWPDSDSDQSSASKSDVIRDRLYKPPASCVPP